MSALAICRRMPRAVDVAIDWAAREGWNPGLHDAAAFGAADPTGFFVGEIDGAPAATISVVKYGASFAFLGLYIVAPEWRGRGHGLALWQAALATAAGRNVGLDGVVAQQDNYRRSGFRLAYRNIRLGGTVRDAGPAHPGVVGAGQVPFDTLVDYDMRHFGAARPAFLRAWIEAPDAQAKVFVRGGALAGFGMVRPARHGMKIGPLFAHDEAAATALLDALLAAAGSGGAISIDVPEPNAQGMRLARAAGLEPVFETARMYTGPAPAIPIGSVYGVTSFELG